MRVGIITPVVLLLPRSHNEWEVDATVDDLRAVVQAADRLGYHHVTASEHVAVPVDVEARRGKRYWDLLATLSYVAALTDRIRLVTNIVVLPYHHPIEIVKHYGTLDVLSSGRVILGVGVGSLRPEFELLGKRFEGRGELADDSIRAIRAMWGRHEPAYDGTHFQVDHVVVDPCAPRTEVPIWVGGRTRRSLRRAVELGDGWMPFLLTPEDVREMLAWAGARPAWRERTRPLDVVLWPEPAIDPLTEADRIRRQADEFVALGGTVLNYRFRSDSLAQHLDQMEALTHLLDFS
jgi:probable F420-dependent oxidoreductase